MSKIVSVEARTAAEIKQTTKEFLVSIFKSSNETYNTIWNKYHSKYFVHEFKNESPAKTMFTYINNKCSKKRPDQSCVLELMSAASGVY